MKRTWIVSFLVALVTMPVAAQDVLRLQPGAGVSGQNLEPYHARYREVSLQEGVAGSGRERTTRLERIRLKGQDGLRIGVTMLGQEGTVYDEVQLLADGLQPVMRFVSALTILHQLEVFDGGSMSGYRIAKDGSAAEPLDVKPDGLRFPGGIEAVLLATMELREGMRIDLPVFSTDMGPEMANLTTRVTVVGSERLEAAGRAWQTSIIEIEQLDSDGRPLTLPNGAPMPKAKKWIAPEPPYGIRTQWQPGTAVELVELR